MGFTGAGVPGRQALLALAHLRNGDTRLAAGFEIGVATAWCYAQEAIALPSADVMTILVLRHVEANRYAGEEGLSDDVAVSSSQKLFAKSRHSDDIADQPSRHT